MEEVKVSTLQKAVVVMATALFFSLLFLKTNKLVVISGVSMEPTLQDGDIVLANSIVGLTPGEIYVVKEPENGLIVVKRLIGIPGDTIRFVKGDTYRNGILVSKRTSECWDNQTMTLGPDEYLLVGDNREKSYDGRHWSRFVHLSEFQYQITTRLYPFDKTGKVG